MVSHPPPTPLRGAAQPFFLLFFFSGIRAQLYKQVPLYSPCSTQLKDMEFQAAHASQPHSRRAVEHRRGERGPLLLSNKRDQRVLARIEIILQNGRWACCPKRLYPKRLHPKHQRVTRFELADISPRLSADRTPCSRVISSAPRLSVAVSHTTKPRPLLKSNGLAGMGTTQHLVLQEKKRTDRTI